MARPEDREMVLKRQERFLLSYSRLGALNHAAKASGIAYSTHLRWMREDKEYPAKFEQARQSLLDHLERECIRRASEGVVEAIYQNGKLVGYRRKYSDVLLIFTMKALAPEKYRDNHHHEITGRNGNDLIPLAAIDRIMANVTEEELRTGQVIDVTATSDPPGPPRLMEVNRDE
jgi:hypothetical protein